MLLILMLWILVSVTPKKQEASFDAHCSKWHLTFKSFWSTSNCSVEEMKSLLHFCLSWLNTRNIMNMSENVILHITQFSDPVR